MENNEEHLIKEAYLEVLGRPADDGGMKTCLNSLKYRSVDDIKRLLRRSVEYQEAKHEITTGEIGKDTAYIDESGDIIWVKPRYDQVLPQIDQAEVDGKKGDKKAKLTIVSTWDIRCGIATYTGYLLKNLNRACGHDIAGIYPVNNRDMPYRAEGDIVHLQHEFGIMPSKFVTGSRMLVTFHTIPKNIKSTLEKLERQYDIIGYIVHFKAGEDIIAGATKKEVWMIPHGSKVIPAAKSASSRDIQASAREWLEFDKMGIHNGDICAFMFGFQSANKNVHRLIDACGKTGIKLIISGGKHQCGCEFRQGSFQEPHIIFLNRYLNEMEVDLFALASDILLFDYVPQDHYSCSGAMHRVIGAGRPVICNRTNHFPDVVEGIDCLKFKDMNELEAAIKEALDKWDALGNRAMDYALRTSWNVAAERHLEIYRKHGLQMEKNK